jgi:hypothetical protein
MTIDEISNYHLLYELLKEGRGELYPELEPLSQESIAAVLRARTGKDFGRDADRWIEWFLAGQMLSDQDKTNLERIRKLADMERKYVPQIEKDRGEQKH